MFWVHPILELGHLNYSYQEAGQSGVPFLLDRLLSVDRPESELLCKTADCMLMMVNMMMVTKMMM